MTSNEFLLHAVFVAGAALFLGTKKEFNNVVWSMFHADRNVADTLEVRELLI